MAKKDVFMDFIEEGSYDTWIKGKLMEDAIYEAIESMKRMIGLGYKIDFFQVGYEEVDAKDGFHIRVTGDKSG